MSLEQIASTLKIVPRRVIIYGDGGSGKSTWASKWPNPVAIDIEGGLSDIEMKAFPRATSVKDVVDAIVSLTGTEDHGFETLVVDSADWLESLIHADVVRKFNLEKSKERRIESVGEIGYGQGYAMSEALMRKLLKGFQQCYDRGMHVVFCSHCAAKRFDAVTGESWDQYSPKLHRSCNEPLIEWCDELFYLAMDITTKTVDKGFNREAHVPIHQEYVIHTIESPTWRAKSRLNLPPIISREFNDFLPFLNRQVAKAETNV